MTLLPTIPQMQQMGLVRCTGQNGEKDCHIWVDPQNVRDGQNPDGDRCKQHRRRARRRPRDRQQSAGAQVTVR